MVKASTVLFVASAVVFAALAFGFLHAPAALVGVALFVGATAVRNEGK